MRAFLFLLLFPTAVFACPPGLGETELTLPQVMRNFGRFLTSADLVALRGSMNSSAVSDADLRTAIEGLEAAQSCATAAVPMIPPKANELRGSEREAYLTLYRDAMENFGDGLSDYETTLRVQLETAPAARSYADALHWHEIVKDRANKAHDALFGHRR